MPINEDPNLSPEALARQALTLNWMKAQPVVLAYIASVIYDRHQAEDLTQEVAATVASTFERYEDDKPFVPWAMGIARNKVLHYLRTNRRDRHIFDEDLLEGLAVAHEKQADAMAERRAALEACLDRLPDRSRSTIKLRYMRDLAVNEIADRLGKTPGAVSNLLHRVRVALGECIRKQLEREGGVK